MIEESDEDEEQAGYINLSSPPKCRSHAIQLPPPAQPNDRSPSLASSDDSDDSNPKASTQPKGQRLIPRSWVTNPSQAKLRRWMGRLPWKTALTLLHPRSFSRGIVTGSNLWEGKLTAGRKQHVHRLVPGPDQQLPCRLLIPRTKQRLLLPALGPPRPLPA